MRSLLRAALLFAATSTSRAELMGRMQIADQQAGSPSVPECCKCNFFLLHTHECDPHTLRVASGSFIVVRRED
jgi:hypothetical protein